MKRKLFFSGFICVVLFFMGCRNEEKKTANETIETEVVDEGVITEADTLKVGDALRNDILINELPLMKPEQRRYSLEKYDLNGDGEDEYFVGFANEYFCREDGCTYFILNANGTLNSRITGSYAPVTILDTKSEGWHNLLMVSQENARMLKHTGGAYPAHPWTLPIVNEDELIKNNQFLKIVLEGSTDYTF